MPQNNTLTPHEMLELREILSIEVLEMKKLQSNMPMVKDENLKTYMQTCLDSKQDKISNIQNFIESNPM